MDQKLTKTKRNEMRFKQGIVIKGRVYYNNEFHDVQFSKMLLCGMQEFERLSLKIAAIDPL